MQGVSRGWSWAMTSVLLLSVSALAQVPDPPVPPGGAGSPATWAEPDPADGALPVPGAGEDGDSSAATSGRTPRRHLQRPLIELSPPEVDGGLLSAIPAELLVGCTYLGDGALAFSLVAGPAGMTIDATVGLLTWTPPASAEGTEVEVRVRATDGSYTAEIAFTLKVATSRPVATSLQGSKLTVTASGSLQGLAFTFPSQVAPQPSLVSVATIGTMDAPAPPEGITKLTDFFRLTHVEAQGEDGIVVTLPARLVPSGVLPQSLRLFVYSDHIQGGDGPAWIAVSNGLDVLAGNAVSLEVYALGELSFVGYETASRTGAATPVLGPPGLLGIDVGLAGETVKCQNKMLPNGSPDPTTYLCTATGDVILNVKVRDMLPNPWTPAATLDDLMAWLVAARPTLEGYGMISRDAIEVVVEQLPNRSWLGVTYGLERFRVLHLSSAAFSKPLMQATAVHEYFHSAQWYSRLPGLASLLDQGDPGEWLIEGTAQWFEDEVFDELNSYRLTYKSPLPPILSAGLAARPQGGAPQLVDPYARFAFMKLVSNRCPGFRPHRVLNVDPVNDPSGLAGFAAALQRPDWQCDFGAGFGAANRASLQTALLQYLWATQIKKSMPMLDSGEPDVSFAGLDSSIAPSKDCRSMADCPGTSRRDFVLIPRAGAKALAVTQVVQLDSNEEAEIEVEKSGGASPEKLWVWIGEQDGDLESGTWFELGDPVHLAYRGTSGAPRMVVLVVNPSTASDVFVNVRARILADYVKTLQFPERLLVIGSCATWTATVRAYPLPAGIAVDAVLAPFGGNQINLNITGKNVTLPSTFIVQGEFDANPNVLADSCINKDGDRVRWTYSNKQIEHNEGSPPHTVTGPAFRFQSSAGGQLPLKWNEPVTVYYDLKIEWLNNKGEVTRTSLLPRRYEAVLQVIVDINSP